MVVIRVHMGSTEYDVAIVGGGINGCVAAKFLAADHDVVVLERDQIASATTASASGLVTVIPDYIAHPGAARYAQDFFHEYDGTRNFEYTARPNVSLATPEREEQMRANAERMGENFEVAYVDTDAIEERFPGMFVLDDVVGGVVLEEGGWVDPYTLAITYKEDAEASGVTFETGVEVTDIETADGAVTGVRTDEGVVEADHVVVAAGYHTKELVSEFVELPIRPFRYQWVNLEVEREFSETFPVAWEDDAFLYWRPEHNGDLHVGGGTYFVDEPGDVRTSTTEEFRDHVARTIPSLVPDLGAARITSGDTCHVGDTATPDELAIFDSPAECPDGLVVATGMHGFGIMASPVTGAAVRSLVTGGDAPFSMDEFALDRFDDYSDDFGSTYIREPSEVPQL
jgi:glycine/D-amino acid oxidase-like deaminating enzyme